MSRVKRLAATILLLLVPAGPSARADGVAASTGEPSADHSCVEDVALRVQRRYESLRDLTARFEQTTRLASLGGPSAAGDTSRGVVTLAKPGKMRWSYEEPEPSLIVSDGETLWTLDPQRGEAQTFPVAEGVLEGAAVQFLLGRGEILREFEIRGGPCSAARVPLALLPREPASYTRLELLVERESGQIIESSIFDLFGNVTRVRFRDVRTDTSPPPETFQLTPPPGVRILELERRD